MVYFSFIEPDLVHATFDQYCQVERRSQSYVMKPRLKNKILVIFCDEINLPEEDEYGTATIITFLRQIITRGGFWRTEDKVR